MQLLRKILTKLSNLREDNFISISQILYTEIRYVQSLLFISETLCVILNINSR